MANLDPRVAAMVTPAAQTATAQIPSAMNRTSTSAVESVAEPSHGNDQASKITSVSSTGERANVSKASNTQLIEAATAEQPTTGVQSSVGKFPRNDRAVSNYSRI